MDIKNKIKTISENFDLINTIRRCHTSDKKLLAKALDISWPTLNTSLKNILYDSSGPIIQNDMGEYDVDKSYGFFLGIAVGGTETKVSIIDFSLNPIGDKSDFFPEYKNILSPKSNIVSFMGDFDVFASHEQENFEDGWRVFADKSQLPPKKLPENK